MKKRLSLVVVAATIAATSLAQLKPLATKAAIRSEQLSVEPIESMLGAWRNINTSATNDLTKAMPTLFYASYSHPEYRQQAKEIAYISDNYIYNARTLTLDDGSTTTTIPAMLAPEDSTVCYTSGCVGSITAYSWETYALDAAIESQDATFAYPASGYFSTPTLSIFNSSGTSTSYSTDAIIAVGGAEPSDIFELSSSDLSSISSYTYTYYAIQYYESSYGYPFGSNVFSTDSLATYNELPTFGNWFITPSATPATLYGVTLYLSTEFAAADINQEIVIGLYESSAEQATLLRGEKLGEVRANVSHILEGTLANAILLPGSEATGIAYWNDDYTAVETELFYVLTFTLDEPIILENGEVCMVLDDYPVDFASGDRFNLIIDPYAATPASSDWYDYTSWCYTVTESGDYAWFDIGSSNDTGMGYASALGTSNINLFINPILELNPYASPAGIEQTTADAAVACKACVNGDVVTLAYEDAAMALVYSVDGALLSTTPLKGTGTSTINIAGNGVYLLKVISTNGTSEVVKIAK